MRKEDFYFDLPEELIAQDPLDELFKLKTFGVG